MKSTKKAMRLIAGMLTLILLTTTIMPNLNIFASASADGLVNSKEQGASVQQQAQPDGAKEEVSHEAAVSPDLSIPVDVENADTFVDEQDVNESDDLAQEVFDSIETAPDLYTATYAVENNTVEFKAEAQAGVLPEDAIFKVVPIIKQEIPELVTEEEKQEIETINFKYDDTQKKLEEKSAEDETSEMAGFLAYDLSFYVEDSETGELTEIQPNGSVAISINYINAALPQEMGDTDENLVAEQQDVTLMHLIENENKEVVSVEDVKANNKVTELATDEGSGIQDVRFIADSFSIYTIVWNQNLSIKTNCIAEDGTDITLTEKSGTVSSNNTKGVSPDTICPEADGYQFDRAVIAGNTQEAIGKGAIEVNKLKIQRSGNKPYALYYNTKSSSGFAAVGTKSVYFIYEKIPLYAVCVDQDNDRIQTISLEGLSEDLTPVDTLASIDHYWFTGAWVDDTEVTHLSKTGNTYYYSTDGSEKIQLDRNVTFTYNRISTLASYVDEERDNINGMQPKDLRPYTEETAPKDVAEKLDHYLFENMFIGEDAAYSFWFSDSGVKYRTEVNGEIKDAGNQDIVFQYREFFSEAVCVDSKGNKISKSENLDLLKALKTEPVSFKSDLLSDMIPKLNQYEYSKAYIGSDLITYMKIENNDIYYATEEDLDDVTVWNSIGSDQVKLMYVQPTGKALVRDVNGEEIQTRDVDLSEITKAVDVRGIIEGEHDTLDSILPVVSAHTYVKATVTIGKEKKDIARLRKSQDGRLQYSEVASGDAWSFVQDAAVTFIYQSEDLKTIPTLDTSGKINMHIFDYESTIGNNKELKFGNGSGYTGNGNGVNQGLLKNTLPVTKSGKSVSYGSPVTKGTGQSLDYLFSPSDSAASYKNTANYLFKDVDGYYYYSAHDNYAYYDKTQSRFQVYNRVYTPNSGDNWFYNQGNFFPFNSISSTDSIKTGFKEIKKSTTNTPVELNGPLYKFKNDSTQNNYFGMSMDFDFSQPRGGIVNNAPMVFEFNGDDDMWVYIDGALVLDLGGVHDEFSGSINFATGKIWYEKINGIDKDKTPSPTIYQQYAAAGKAGDYEWVDVDNDGTPDTFANWSEHQLNLYYMERGGGASNCKIKFNLPLIEKESLMVSKELINTNKSEYADVEFKFKLFLDETGKLTEDDKAKFQQVKDGTVYKLYKDGKDTGTTGKVEDGIFKLKHGESAVFGNVSPETKYYVQEVGLESLEYDQVNINDWNVTLRDTDGNKIDSIEKPDDDNSGDLENQEYVAESPLKQAGDASTVVFQNSCSAYNRKELSIKKVMSDEQTANSSDLFKFYVTLGGKLYSGDYYLNDEEDARTMTDGTLTLHANDVATICDIPSDTTYSVVEYNLGGKFKNLPKYSVETYTRNQYDSTRQTDEKAVNDNGTSNKGVSGMMYLKTDTRVTVENTKKPLDAVLQVSKSARLADLANPSLENGEEAWNARTYLITLGVAAKDVVSEEDTFTASINDIVTADFKLTDHQKSLIEDNPNIHYQENSNGTTSVTWSNQTISREEAWTDTLEIVAKDTFFGGNDVATNTTASNVAVEGYSKAALPVPYVNVKCDFEVNEIADVIFRGNSVNSKLNEKTVDELAYDLPEGANAKRFSVAWKQSDEDITNWEAEKPDNMMQYQGEVTYKVPNRDAQHSAMADRNSTINGRVFKVENFIKNASYMVDVVYGEIDLTKMIDENYSKETVPNHNQSFSFEINRYDAQGTLMETFYEVINFKQGKVSDGISVYADGTEAPYGINKDQYGQGTKVINKLPAGYYSVKEDTSWSWKYDLTSAKINDQSTTLSGGKTEQFYIGEERNKEVNGAAGKYFTGTSRDFAKYTNYTDDRTEDVLPGKLFDEFKPAYYSNPYEVVFVNELNKEKHFLGDVAVAVNKFITGK